MKINSIQCNQLGGIKNKDVNFSEGLNVILGPNEAGKSTLVEAIFSAIFRKHRLLKNNAADKEFAQRFRPYPNGDSMIAKLKLDINGMDYEICKEWGANPSVYMTVDGQIIKDEETITRKLQELLKYGEKTYENIVFAKQKDIKEALNRISNDEETSNSLGDILRKALMALDGVSIEKLKRKLDEECKLLQGRWDIRNNRPEGNKGIENRWKVGVGEVLSCFYKKEEIWNAMVNAKQTEQEYSASAKELKVVENNKRKVKTEIDGYKKIEGDILQRAIMEPKIDNLKKDIEELRRVNKEYPVKEETIKIKEKELKEMEQEIGQLTEELKLARKTKEVKDARELLAKIDGIGKEIAQVDTEKNMLIVIEDVDIKKLEELQNKMDTAKVSMQAGTLLGRLNKTKKPILITRGLQEKEEINEGSEFLASGYLKVEIDADFELEIKAGEINFEDLKNQYNEAKDELNLYFNKFKVQDLADAKIKHRLHKELLSKIEERQSQIKLLLGDSNIEELRVKVSEAQDIQTRTEDEINEVTDTKNKLIINLSGEIGSLENTLKEWGQKYGDIDKVLDMLVSHLKDTGEIEESLQRLAELPEEFKTPKEYQEHLLGLEVKYDEILDSESKLKKRFYEIKSKLPDVTYEELQPIFNEAETRFQKRLARLNHLLKARQVFEKKVVEMDQGSFEPLTKAFSKYLSIVTLGKYDNGTITDSLSVEAIQKDNKRLPIELLSSGTYDCVLLALRLSILDYLFGGKNGLVVLDDCLVNLDPSRKQRAAELIKEFSCNNQVIFTTCDPNTAFLLGGNRIQLQLS